MDNNLIKTKVATATKWSSITEILIKLVTPITSMLLARLLTPEAFGVVATINLVISFSDMFTDAGFQKYLVQHEFETEEDLNKSTNVAFWSNLAVSVFIYIGICIYADPIAKLVGNEGLGNTLRISCIIILMTSFSSIQMARYRRSLNFKTLFKVRVIAAVIPFVITVPLAFLLRNYWALIIGIMSTNLFNAVFLTALSAWKPKLYFSWRRLKEMLSFSLWSLLEAISIWLTSYIDTFIVGSILSSYYLGLYKTSMTTINSYMGIITAATTPVLFSALSRQQNNDVEFKKTFYKFQCLVAALVFPMAAGLFLYKDLATQILLGSQWKEAAGFMGLWALTSGITIIFSHYNSEIFRSKGRPKLSFLSQCIHLVFLVPILLCAAYMGFEALYISRSLIRLQMIVVSQIILWVCFKMSFLRTVKNVLPSLIATCLMSLTAFGLQFVNDTVIWSIISIFICIIVYFCILMCFPSMRSELIQSKVFQKYFRKGHRK